MFPNQYGKIFVNVRQYDITAPFADQRPVKLTLFLCMLKYQQR
jgi:hypothetical protein